MSLPIKKLSNGIYIYDHYHPNMEVPIIQEKYGRRVYCAQVYKDEVELASEAENFWGKRKKGNISKSKKWTKGFTEKPFLKGKLGEIAFARIFGLPVDFAYRDYGDKQDALLVALNRTLQDEDERGYARIQKVEVKAAGRFELSCLLRATSDRGSLISLDKDIYVFSYLSSFDIDPILVTFLGWMNKEDIIGKGLVDALAKNASHKNYNIRVSDLDSMEHLYNGYFYYGRH